MTAWHRRIALAIVLAGVLGAQQVQAEPVADFYRGRTVTLSVGTSPGSKAAVS